MDDTKRRRVLQLGGAALVSGLAGCNGILGNDIQDTDGDGVIDSEDYAPRDPEIQREEQVKGEGSTETETETQAETETETETETQAETPVAGEDLISWWPFSQNVNDTAGDNDASAPIGNPQIETVADRTAVRFDGDDGLRVARGGNEPELSLLDRNDGPASITMQVYFAEPTGSQPFEGTGTPRHSILRNDTGYNITAKGESGDSSVNLRFGVRPYSDTPSRGYSMPDDVQIPLSVQEWHQISVVFNSTKYVRIYVDDERVFADDSMQGYNNAASDFWPDITIGSWYGGNPEEWANLMNGAISDLRMYGTGLTAEEISQIYTNTN
ncbi:LamG-like jellyroll fold domain-containing protein [Halorubrum aethiopicum]|uniref:LamG-like jellyroll fold domain-containing protein n=1 Tax=Halorubrum aethiopicum TaxID=1758255 RepID=UPI0012FEEAEB|nr:LamG-like jellyroll fold domain-containing protein [Halorubrum aethiopicum]